MPAERRRLIRRLLLLCLLAIAAVAAAALTVSSRARFLTGGAMINVGYRLQDSIHDFRHHDGLRPEDVWNELVEQNKIAASVRKQFPRSALVSRTH